MEKLARAHVLICGGTGCSSSGSKEIIPEMRGKLKAKGMEDEIKVVETGCHGLCELGPLVIVYPEGVFYIRVKASDVEEIVENHLIKGRVVDRLLYREPATHATVPDYDDIAFYKKQQRYALVNCGHINPESLEEYIGTDGYEGLAKALSMKPEEVIEEVKKSGLRGRGGGGFPTGTKWQFTRNAVGSKKYVICNADEGDPGAFMDRSVLEGDPHRVLEGMIICGYAVGADEGYIYCRAEYPLAIKRLRGAIGQALESGLLGENILGSGFNFMIHIKEGAGAFVCGEETALIASIEGRRGMPRPRPPFPANSGLWGKPSNINNVETFANVPSIMRDGGDYFASQGTETSKGTKVFALTGKINNTGLAEVPMGITMREIIYDIGGGIPNGKKFKAVQIGGPSGGCLPEQLLDLAVDYESLIRAGAMMGSGGLVVMDETTCMVDVARYFLNFTQDESCGKCTPCREGTKRMLEILNRICEGKGTEEDIPLLESMAQSIKAGSLCALGQTAPNPVLSTLNFFRHEYEAHIRDHKCPAGVCTAFVGYTITEGCRGCGLCKKVCPADAISGEVKAKHIIDPDKCIKCGACQSKCPFKAIEKG
ncbi:MAG: NADH-quinone oxidoreductase subunit NuoF [Synergistaceae bacterium]|jgi:NADH-quinone oxidoreductase subunit F/NADP-reducing hydrogenase subunit HndC|nr:NADH-quinone oxidoreductase subunit NuoF [Synergistaceae bacterium]